MVGEVRLAQAERRGEVVELHDQRGRSWARVTHSTHLEKLANGYGVITRAQREAGERLCRTWYFAGLSAKVTARWGESPVDRSLVGERSITERQANARIAFTRAMQALGPSHSSVVAVAIEDLSINQWCATRSGRARAQAADSLREGLRRLMAHYGERDPDDAAA